MDIEALAERLWEAFADTQLEECNVDSGSWGELLEEEKVGWRGVAEWVQSRKA